MAEPAELTGDMTAAAGWIEAFAAAVEGGFRARLTSIGQIGADVTAVQTYLGQQGWSLSSVLLACVAAALVTYGIVHGTRVALDRRIAASSGWRRLLAESAGIVIAFVVMLVGTRLLVANEAIRSNIRLWVLATILCVLAHMLLKSLLRVRWIQKLRKLRTRQRSFRQLLTFGVCWALFGVALSICLRFWQAGSGLRDVVGTLFISLPVALLLAFAYGRYHLTVAVMLTGPRPISRPRRRLAAVWPWIAIAAIVMTFVVAQVSLLLGRPLPGLPTFLTLLLFLVAPHIDAVLARWAEHGLDNPKKTVLAVALRRTVRFASAITVLILLGYMWVLPVFVAFGANYSTVTTGAVELALISLASAFLWNVVGSLTSRVAKAEGHSGTAVELSGPRSRLGTLLPLLGGTAKASIFALAMLTMLISIGVNVWPIITGLSVFGLAIGFGSQTLVKDIVSGLFFLIDDAFRLGEYIESSGAKGTVEKISIRSVSLRHARGALTTLPYGQIGKVQNFSRDWVIEKLVFRVPFDTDVDQVRKLFKKVGQDIADDPELNQDLLEPFKSQGIADVEDGTLLIRGKFKAKAGKQFAVRKAVLTAVQQGFRDYGIIAVPKPLSLPSPVTLPPSPAEAAAAPTSPAPAPAASPSARPAAPVAVVASAPTGTSS
ncbi:mechanosensitive ion channel family protein [Microvirga pudoricolor]|uniref:mechanosensitive ion channel family protein n=1 Tax=Microvirga pudoricolor TaxID=2778729 RepID=UPI00194ECB0E|nr:mechanosensitive ion channel family protein [Microvirga pudoricolor]MBM6596333.1 mechanosensitive ion channel family protein [Microvirga pudoricolor]